MSNTKWGILVDFMSMTIILFIGNTKYNPILGCLYKEGAFLNVIIKSINGNQQSWQLFPGQTQREASNKNLLSEKLKYHWKLADKDLKLIQQKQKNKNLHFFVNTWNFEITAKWLNKLLWNGPNCLQIGNLLKIEYVSLKSLFLGNCLHFSFNFLSSYYLQLMLSFQNS